MGDPVGIFNAYANCGFIKARPNFTVTQSMDQISPTGSRSSFHTEVFQLALNKDH